MNTILLIAIGAVALIIIILLIVRSSRKKGSGATADAEYVNEQVYIGNLPYHVSERDLSSFFAKYGNIKHTKVVKNYKTGRSKGFAFITFNSFEEAEKALQAHGEVMKGRNMVVRIAKPR